MFTVDENGVRNLPSIDKSPRMLEPHPPHTARELITSRRPRRSSYNAKPSASSDEEFFTVRRLSESAKPGKPQAGKSPRIQTSNSSDEQADEEDEFLPTLKSTPRNTLIYAKRASDIRKELRKKLKDAYKRKQNEEIPMEDFMVKMQQEQNLSRLFPRCLLDSKYQSDNVVLPPIDSPPEFSAWFANDSYSKAVADSMRKKTLVKLKVPMINLTEVYRSKFMNM